MDTPVLGVQGDETPGGNHWQVSVGWRYQHSFRHFVGSNEQEDRADDGSQVVNHIHLLDIGILYRVSDRTSVTLSIPYLMAERSSAIRDANRVVIGRYTTQARGLSDIMLTGRWWLRDPKTHAHGNVALGVGVKLPTGATNVTDTRLSFDATTGTIVSSVQTVDQSIQPGDGGFGFLLDLGAFQRFAKDRVAWYFSGAYLFNPEGENGVLTYRSRPTEATMSIADQYVVRSGFSFAPRRAPHWTFSIGGRWEGVPATDLIGPSTGFRRPGFAISVEPSLAWSRGASTVTFAVPAAVHRNRTRSVSDIETGGHGDAAFADYLFLAGYARKF